MNWLSMKNRSISVAKIGAMSLVLFLSSCNPAPESECDLKARYTFNFEQAQYYGLPVIDFSFNLSYDWQVRMPEFYYFQTARVNDDSTGSVLLTVKPFKRQGVYVSVSEQSHALVRLTINKANRDSWITEQIDTVDSWWVHYGRYEQEPKDFVIAHKLVQRDSTSNGLLLELQMDCAPGKFSTKNERCLQEIERSFKISL
jgi:hypothetical protein